MQLHKLHLGILFISDKLCFKPMSIQRHCVYAKYEYILHEQVKEHVRDQISEFLGINETFSQVEGITLTIKIFMACQIFLLSYCRK